MTSQGMPAARARFADLAARALEPLAFRGKGRVLRTLAGSHGTVTTRVFG